MIIWDLLQLVLLVLLVNPVNLHMNMQLKGDILEQNKSLWKLLEDLL